VRYPSDRLHEEVAQLAYYFHWPHDQIMALEHRDRQRWIAELGRLHARLAGQPPSAY
jgi:hypothetical protein